VWRPTPQRPVYITDMRAADFPTTDGPPPFEPDPVIEAYKKDVDRSLIRENLSKTPDQRMRALVALQHFATELRRAGRESAGR